MVHPVHGMLEQEQRAGAVLPVVHTSDLVLQQTERPGVFNGFGAIISADDPNGDVHAIMYTSSYKNPGVTFYRSNVFGYPIIPGSYAPNSWGFACDADSIGTAPSVKNVFYVYATGAAVYDGNFWVYDAALARNWGTLNWNTAKDQFRFEVGFKSGGAQRDLAFCSSGGVERWKIAFSSGAHLLASADDTVNIGAASGNRPRELFMSPGTAAHAQINLPASVAPSAPVNGDIWFDGTNLKIQIGGATKTFTVA